MYSPGRVSRQMRRWTSWIGTEGWDMKGYDGQFSGSSGMEELHRLTLILLSVTSIATPGPFPSRWPRG